MIDIHKPLIVLELANNHGGSLEHGLDTIFAFSYSWFREYAKRIQVAFKFQYRTLDTFIHPDYQNRDDIKYVKRFKSTELKEDEFLQLKKAVEDAGFHTMCTPFDEAAARRVKSHGYEVLKIGSCSCTDFPLLEESAKTGLPMIVSTAGVSLEDIDKVVSFLNHRKVDFGLMHCVAEYPVADKDVQLNQIDLLRNRYPGIPIGFSTHEAPIDLESGMMAVAKGATIFERHIGYRTDEYPLNAYSMPPVLTERWMLLIEKAFEMCGVTGVRHQFSASELKSLQDLRRGIFVSRDIKKDEKISASDVFFAIPTVGGQLTANDFSKYTKLVASEDIEKNKPVCTDNAHIFNIREPLLAYIKKIKSLIKKSGVIVPEKSAIEISHHYGLSQLDKFGGALITIVNRGYCKKLIIMAAGQKHPPQYHQIKEETFHVLHGEVTVDLGDHVINLKPGGVVTIPPSMVHSMWTKDGVVIEELSTTHQAADSFYLDPTITTNTDRKTLVHYWEDVQCE